MKFALSSRQPISFLNQADEIIVKYPDRDFVYTVSDRHSDKVCILEIPYMEKEVDWTQIQMMAQLNPKFCCRLARLDDIEVCEELNIPYFYGMIIDRWEDLNYIAATNSKYIAIGGDLLFDVKKVKTFGKPIRVIPNALTDMVLRNFTQEPARNLTVVGDWFGPGGTKYFDPYIDVIEFDTDDERMERGLFNMYKKNTVWPIELNKLVRGLECDDEVRGRLIEPESFYTARISCGRNCLKTANPSCRICERVIWLADKQRLLNYKAAMEQQKDKNNADEPKKPVEEETEPRQGRIVEEY